MASPAASRRRRRAPRRGRFVSGKHLAPECGAARAHRILEATRGLDWEAYDRSVDVLVSRLRGKLGDDARRPRLIRTVRGTGYSFIGGGGEGD